jgi:hypothetical protein
MAANRPYGEFYDFYSVSPEYFGYRLVNQPQMQCLGKVPPLLVNKVPLIRWSHNTGLFKTLEITSSVIEDMKSRRAINYCWSTLCPRQFNTARKMLVRHL